MTLFKSCSGFPTKEEIISRDYPVTQVASTGLPGPRWHQKNLLTPDHMPRPANHAEIQGKSQNLKRSSMEWGLAFTGHPTRSTPKTVGQEAMCVSTRVFHKNTFFPKGVPCWAKCQNGGQAILNSGPHSPTPSVFFMKRLCLNGQVCHMSTIVFSCPQQLIR